MKEAYGQLSLFHQVSPASADHAAGNPNLPTAFSQSALTQLR